MVILDVAMPETPKLIEPSLFENVWLYVSLAIIISVIAVIIIYIFQKKKTNDSNQEVETNKNFNLNDSLPQIGSKPNEEDKKDVE